MRFGDFLAAEWKPALGCTEPAAIAHAAALAATQASGAVERVRLVCDARTYKNAFAVGIPNSEGRTGILWALAIGAHLPDASLGLRAFEAVTPDILARARTLIEAGGVSVDVGPDPAELRIDCTVVREGRRGRAVLEREHTRLALLQCDGVTVGGAGEGPGGENGPTLRALAGAMKIREMVALVKSLSPEDRESLRRGSALNLAMAEHGLKLLSPAFMGLPTLDPMSQASRWVAAGVYARMSGEPLTVMSLAGSGNKGITVAVPLNLWGRHSGYPQERIDEALALACILTSATTHHLGTLSAVCGASNAAGIGIASAWTHLQGGTVEQIGYAIANMVGGVAGMICDGAKIGCAMKTLTGVDSAYRAASLALADMGIPSTDGIVGADGDASLENLGSLARRGMARTDEEILRIMQGKLQAQAPG
jgi:L-cysteine desulfidase